MSTPGGAPAPTGPAKSHRVWLLTGAVLVVLAVVAVVAWLVVPDTSDSPSTATVGPAITGDTVEQVLLDGAELTTMLDEPFTKTIRAPKHGGRDEMEVSTTPGDCVGVVDVAPKSVYRSADVQSYARQTWGSAAPGDAAFTPLSTTLMFVDEAVIALPSAADARALFATFSAQWQRCNGQAVNQEPDTSDPDDPPPLPGSEMHILGVRATDTVLAASVVLDKKPEAPDARAIGLQGNCLVEVLLPFTGVDDVPGSADPETSGIAVVRAMMDKVDKLS